MYPVLETERLLLTPLVDNDLNEMYRVVSNPVVTYFAEWNLMDDLKKFHTDFPKFVACGRYWSIRLKENNNYVGFFGIALSKCKKGVFESAHTVILTLPEYWNNDFEIEATKKILHFAFLGIKTNMVTANHLLKNPAAGAALEKCGFQKYNGTNSLAQFRLFKEDYFKQNNINIDERSEIYIFEHTPENRPSPYTYSNPIRKIDSINYIKQPTDYLCGQSVIAMLASVSVDDVVIVAGNDRGMGVLEVQNALKYYGFKTVTKTRMKYTEGVRLPECCVLSIKLPAYGHWSLYYKGKFYDPEFGIIKKLPENAMLVSYWEITI